MENVILHISDLHVTMYKGYDGILTPRIDSYLTTNSDETINNLFLETLIQKVKTDFKDKKINLVITGDIANRAEKIEYEFAEKIISRLLKDLAIENANCLLIPGDHDVHRRSLENALADTPTDEPHLLNEVKFKNFGEFYSKIKGSEFPSDKIISDHIILDDKVVLLAINSNFKVNNRGGEGNIPIDRLKDELTILKSSISGSDLQYVACWHHNFTAHHDDKNNGQWEGENRLLLLAALESLEIKLVLTGNEHTSGSSAVNGTVMMSDCGTLSSKGYDAAFKVYPVIVGDEILLQNKIYGLQKTGGNDQSFFWQLRDNKSARQPEEFKLHIPNNELITSSFDLPHVDNGHETQPEIAENVNISRIFYDNPEKSRQLYEIVRDKKLFHSGHFHWSNSSRAHNWIDISTLLEDHNDLVIAQNAIIDVITKFELDKNASLIIGLGYEGNIISSKASIKFNTPYTSLPYSYRYKDHHDYEKKLNFDNAEGVFKKVIIITDVVNDGRTIRKLIDKREKQFFEKVEEVVVVSLFYTGHEQINTNILNYDKLPPSYDKYHDHNVNNISFYTVKSLKVEKCPYGQDFRTECFIFRDDLSCVHLFYDDVVGKEVNTNSTL